METDAEQIEAGPEVTVAINVYNGMPYLEQALDSIRNQTVQNIEIILVNDGSTDGTREYLDSVSDPRIRVFHQENSGTNVASNLAIKECRTPFLMRMDADDIAKPDRVAIQLDYMKKHPECGMSGCQAAWFGENGVGKSIKVPTTHEQIWQALVNGHHAMVHATLIMRISSIRKIGGYWDIPRLDDDTDMMLRMGEQTKLANIEDSLYLYRILQGSLSGASMRRVRFSYEYSIELSRRRLAGLPQITPEEYEKERASWPVLKKVLWQVDFHARCQYRRAVGEIFSGNRLVGGTRLAWSAFCSPSLTLQRLKRIFRRNKTACTQ